MARSTYPSQKWKELKVSDHSWKVEMSKKCTPLWCETHFQVKIHKAHHSRTTFGSCDVCDVEKVHAVVARSALPSQNVQSTPFPDHFGKLRCRKSARRWGANHMSKSKASKSAVFGPLLDVQMSFRVACARDCARCQKSAKREGFVAVSAITTTSTLHNTTLHYTPSH